MWVGQLIKCIVPINKQVGNEGGVHLATSTEKAVGFHYVIMHVINYNHASFWKERICVCLPSIPTGFGKFACFTITAFLVCC